MKLPHDLKVKMTSKSKAKGNREERAIKELFNDVGIECKRVPLSGACEGFKGDLIARINGEDVRIESKVRAEGFRELYKWIEGNDILIVRADRKEHLAILPLKHYLKDIA